MEKLDIKDRIKELNELISQAEFVNKYISKRVSTHLKLLKIERIHLQKEIYFKKNQSNIIHL